MDRGEREKEFLQGSHSQGLPHPKGEEAEPWEQAAST